MRSSFIVTLTKLAKINKDVFLLTGDLGYSVFEDFKREFPDRFFNIGIAEQNMIGVASGLALSGKIVFVYSIIPFVTLRCYEQIRNDLCMQNLNVKIVGMGAGLHYGSSGPTHHALDDINIMRSLPNMTILIPSSPLETERAMKESVKQDGPFYIRLGKAENLLADVNQSEISLGKGVLVQQGKDITIVSCGSILQRACDIAKELKSRNISTRVINIRSIKPMDKDIILSAAKETNFIFVLEEHSLIGGLGSVVAEILAESSYNGFFKRLALPDKFIKEAGSRDYLLARHGLSLQQLTETILNNYKKV